MLYKFGSMQTVDETSVMWHCVSRQLMSKDMVSLCQKKFISILVLIIRGVPNSGFGLFGRIRVVLWIRIRIRKAFPAEHFDAAPAVLILTTSLNSCGCLYNRCLLSMLSSHDPLPFIRLIVSQAVRTRTSCTDSEFGRIDVSIALHYVRIRIHYSDNYSAPMRIRSEYSVHPC